MATFKDLWNYPNNSANGYAADSANWSGDDSFGIDKRMKDLRDGTYKTHAGVTPNSQGTNSTALMNTAIAKYAYGLELEGPDENLTMYNMWWNPIIEATTYGSHNLTPNKIESNGSDIGTIVYKVTTSANHGLNDALYPNSSGGVGNFDVDFKSTTDTELPSAVSTHLNDTSQIKIARAISGDNDSIWVSSNTITAAIPNVNIDEQTVFISTSNGVKSYSQYAAHTSEVTDSTKIRYFNGSTGEFLSDSTNDTGTLNAVNSDRYLTKSTITGVPGGTDLTVAEWFTDSGKSTRATLDERYYATIKFTLTNNSGGSRGFNMSDLQFTGATYTKNDINVVESISAGTGSNTAVDTFDELRAKMVIERGTQTGGTGPYNGIQSFCRLQLANVSGTVTPIGDTITTSIDKDELVFAMLDESTNKLDISTLFRGDGFNHGGISLTLANGASCELLVHVIDPGRIHHPNVNGNVSSVAPEYLEYTSGLGTMARKGALDKYYVSAFDVVAGGSATYTYKNSSNADTNGAELNTKIYYEFNSASPYYVDNTSGVTLTTNTKLHPAVTLDGNGRFASIATPVRGTGGIFDANTNKFMITFKALDDQYVDTSYAPDNFDTDDEWDSDGFESGLKRWPTSIVPVSAKLVENQPSTSNISQSGQKFVRSAGIIRTELELEYGPLTYDEFRLLYATAQAAQGQKVPFYVNFVGYGPNNDITILAHRQDANKDGGLTGVYDFRFRNAVSIGDKTMLVEGFPSNFSKALAKGETIICNIDYRNGDLVTVINDANSNIFGEAKIRVPYPAAKTQAVGDQLYKNPSHAVVTLADDSFEYQVTTEGYYYLSCKFVLDEFK